MKSMVSVLVVKAVIFSQAIVCCATAFIVCPSLSSSSPSSPSSSGGVVISTTSSTVVTAASSRHAAQQYSTTTSSLNKLNYSVGGDNNNKSNSDNESKSNKNAASSAFADNIGLSGIESLSTIIPSTKKEIVSPFDATASKKKKNEESGIPAFLQSAFEDGGDREEEDQQQLDLTIENVDKVLDEIRPYLISDGGNVNVKRLDEETGDIYLQLEGACGSCSSSKVTMKMGIERTLKFKFSGQLGKVIEVVDDSDSNPGKEEGGATKQLITIEQQVENEIRRISNAVIAMGGAIKILNVDSTTNEVTILYRGPQKVRKGIELALLDNDQMNVKHVKFVDDDKNK